MYSILKCAVGVVVSRRGAAYIRPAKELRMRGKVRFLDLILSGFIFGSIEFGAMTSTIMFIQKVTFSYSYSLTTYDRTYYMNILNIHTFT